MGTDPGAAGAGAATFRLVSRSPDSGFLSLPWGLPLEEWPPGLVVELDRGISRHVVRFVAVGGAYYALKELPPDVARREYRLLQRLGATSVPAVDPAGVLLDRRPDGAGDELPAVLITRYLEYSLPFRLIMGRQIMPSTEALLLESVAELLVRLHLAGFFWGDCSLSNILFRRDAGMLEAYLVDAETGELHPSLTYGQRRHDLEVARENMTFELFDVAAQFGLPQASDPTAVADDVLARYDRLWADVTGDEVFGADETARLEERLAGLHALGFDIEEIEVVREPGGYRLRLQSHAVAGHHRRRLLRLTGLLAQENQARRLLADITSFSAWLERNGSPPVSEAAAAARWVSDVFEPAVTAVPPELRGRRDAAEVFHEVLEHRWFLSERAGREIPTAEAVAAYIETVLRPAPDERTAVLHGDTAPAPPEPDGSPARER